MEDVIVGGKEKCSASIQMYLHHWNTGMLFSQFSLATLNLVFSLHILVCYKHYVSWFSCSVKVEFNWCSWSSMSGFTLRTSRCKSNVLRSLDSVYFSHLGLWKYWVFRGILYCYLVALCGMAILKLYCRNSAFLVGTIKIFKRTAECVCLLALQFGIQHLYFYCISDTGYCCKLVAFLVLLLGLQF